MISFLTILRKSKSSTKALHCIKTYSTSDVVEDIIIPKRIPRGPTDILRALESTIKRDPTATHYKYHDDPFLIPTSNLAKRSYALAQESGRKAAHWVRKENRNLFLHQEADPMIASFAPKMVYDDNSTVSEEDLQNVIKEALVSDAVLIYNLLKQKDIPVSQDVKQSLLELLCYYNQIDPVPEEFIEERWFRQTNKGKERQRKTWKDGTLAEEIFISIEKPSREAYSALIQGMIKYGQIDRAWQLYEEAQEKNVVVSTEAYNSVLNAVTFIREDNDLRWNLIIDTLSAMRQAQIQPNVGTLNAVLKTISMMGTSKHVKKNLLRTITEFKNLGIEPSLTSWYYVLITFCKERGPKNLILNDIINYLEGKELKIQDLKDTYFFATAMDVCRFHLYDNDLAKRVHNLLHVGNNYDLIGDSYKESIYYRHYVSLMSETESFEDFMEKVYYKVVPHIYIPEPSVMVDILKSAEAHGAIDYLPSLWSDIVIFDHTNRENIVTLVLDIMIVSDPPHSTTELPQKFADISWNIWNKLREDSQQTTKLTPTGELLGRIMTLLLRNKEFTKAIAVMEVLDKDQSIVGIPNFESLSLFVDNCIENKVPNRAITCIQYAADRGFEDATNLATTLHKALVLDENHLKKLSTIFGSELFYEQATS